MILLRWIKRVSAILGPDKSSGSGSGSGSGPSSGSGSSNPRRRDDNWVDGFRGVASFQVLTGHILVSFCNYLHSPALSENGDILLLQYPFLRIIMGGRGAVSVFFIITGYVTALGPTKRFAAGDTTNSLYLLCRSCFSRTGRLVFPTSIAVIITWILSQLGAFRIGQRIDAYWIKVGCNFNDSFLESLPPLFRQLTVFWKTSDRYYDATHWSLPWFLTAAFRVYVILQATALVKRRARYAIIVGLWVYGWMTEDFLVGLSTMVGMLLAQLQVDLGPRTANMLPTPVPSLIMILGLFLWCFPLHNPDWASWSHVLAEILRFIGPPTKDDILSRYYTSLGASLVMVGILFSPTAKRILTLPFFNFLGRCSFAVYLIHNMLMRSVLVWILYGYKAWTTPVLDDEGETIELKRPGPLAFCLGIPLFYVIVYVVAYLWTTYVDVFCFWLTNRLCDFTFKPDEKVMAHEIATRLPASAPAAARPLDMDESSIPLMAVVTH